MHERFICGVNQTNLISLSRLKLLTSEQSTTLNIDQQLYWVKFHIIPEMTSHRLSVVKFKIKISSYFLNKALS